MLVLGSAHFTGWRTPGRPNQVRVGIAWDDGTLRLWDVGAADGQIRGIADARYNNSAALLDPSTLVTTRYPRIIHNR